MRYTTHRLAIPLILLTFFLSGCVLAESMTLSSSRGGSSSATLDAYPFFIDVLEDFSTFTAEPSDDSILDVIVRDFVTGLVNSQKALGINTRKTGRNSYVIDFTFQDFNALFNALAGNQEGRVLSLNATGNRTTLALDISLDTYDELSRIIPFLTDPGFEVYGPLYNQDMSADEYLEMIGYILGEDGPKAITDSRISLRFTTPAPIVSSQGVRIISSSVCEFSFPLIDFLLLHSPLTFSVTW
ncbi:hypothetical protein [Parasphaerochaeta coccoides]|uniref:Lipoprotein n=1 Tax=Parasphaerochaeta coccoides (strain ATCC BAA-1237 / DSM 17374 / SPN1) TaxID=760011 RepID=F4GKC2_PARC1|nr:hypothetical protein [Parasphaerochaeta coccoides]AEC02318.1 hypothetical protein Spico_1097 [Parasphaerochaeta coccoides DSM 17374]